jgi:hypothetical protein
MFRYGVALLPHRYISSWRCRETPCVAFWRTLRVLSAMLLTRNRKSRLSLAMNLLVSTYRNFRSFHTKLNPDLDSMSCSLLYAYIRSLSPPKNAFTPLYVPITNIPAADIQLRPEFLAVFKHANIESGHLITLDDLPALSEIETQLAPENTKWILVDHNALLGASLGCH